MKLRLMKLELEPSEPFNLDATLCCGQVFRWERQGQWWYGVVRDKVLKIRQLGGNQLEFDSADAGFVRAYFGLDDDLPEIYKQIGKDEYARQAVNAYRGLRILRQDPWECLISYICATYKNIASIKQMLLNLSRRFGDKISLDGVGFCAFPTSQSLAKADIKELTECSLGYRAKYVSETAKIVERTGFDFESLRRADCESARKALLNFPGVGKKVADCVLLFSLGKLEAFPVDVWVKRVIVRHYSKHFSKEFIEKISLERSPTVSEYDRLNSFGRRYFGDYAGYAQEYLYHYERVRG